MNKKIMIPIAIFLFLFIAYAAANFGDLQGILRQSEIGKIQRAYNSEKPCEKWELHYGKCIKCLDVESDSLKKYYNLYCIDGCVSYCARW